MAAVGSEERELIERSRPFSTESIARSWGELIAAFVVLGGSLALAALAPWWSLRLVGSTIAGLTSVRVFILYHDHFHGALLRKSPVAKALLSLFGVYVLTPPKVWRQTHNYHHAHTGQVIGSHIGSFGVLTPKLYEGLTPKARFMYRAARHPMTIVLGYLTVFFWGMCLSAFLRDPKKNLSAAVYLIAHIAAMVGVTYAFGFEILLVCWIVPLFVACGSGGYLFYAQHNFESVYYQPRAEWSYGRAALESSSFMELGPVMNWFTGNIGYHHVHHLNPTIPFYRLPEAMEAIEELRSPRTTRLTLKDMWRCLRLDLWDPDAGRMVTFAEARAR